VLGLSLTVTNGSVAGGVAGLNHFIGTIDANGKATVIVPGVRRDSFVVVFAGDTFQLHGDTKCGHIDGVGIRSSE
jgi:hypothetical protein